MELLNHQYQIPIDIKSLSTANIDLHNFKQLFHSGNSNCNDNSTESDSQNSGKNGMYYYDYNGSNQPTVTPNTDSNSVMESNIITNFQSDKGLNESSNQYEPSLASYNVNINPPSNQYQHAQQEQPQLNQHHPQQQQQHQQHHQHQHHKLNSQRQFEHLNTNQVTGSPLLQINNIDFKAAKSHSMPTIDLQHDNQLTNNINYRSISQPTINLGQQNNLLNSIHHNHSNHQYPFQQQLPQQQQSVPYPQQLQPRQQPHATNVDVNFQFNSPNRLNHYPDMTTMVNSNSNIIVPLVESTFVDHRVCTICGRRITRDMTRHMRTHQKISRFSCKFPENQCRHKSGRFNRPYDFKKHLLNRHFKFDEIEIRKLHNLSDKLNHWGTCPCGLRFMGKDFLDDHILTKDKSKKCPMIK